MQDGPAGYGTNFRSLKNHLWRGRLDLGNAVVEPIHEKAMPVMLMTPEDVEQWLRGHTVDDALKMQKPAPDDAIVIRPTEKKAALATK